MAKLFLVLMCLTAGCLTWTAANPFFFFNLQPAPTITVSQPTVSQATNNVGIGNLFSKWFTITKSFGATQRPRPTQRPVIQIDPIYVPVDLEKEEGPTSTTEAPAELIESSTEKKITTTERITTTTTTEKLTTIDTTERTSTSTESTTPEEEYIKPTTYRPSTTSSKTTTTTTESEKEIENENEIDSGSEDSSNEIIKPATTTTSTTTSTTTEASEEVAEVTEGEIPISLTYLPPLSGRNTAASIKTASANTVSSNRTPFDIISVNARAGDTANDKENVREDANEEEPDIDPRVFYY